MDQSDWWTPDKMYIDKSLSSEGELQYGQSDWWTPDKMYIDKSLSSEGELQYGQSDWWTPEKMYIDKSLSSEGELQYGQSDRIDDKLTASQFELLINIAHIINITYNLHK